MSDSPTSPISPTPDPKDQIVQIYTNNDGTVRDILSGAAYSQELKRAAAALVADAQPPDSSSENPDTKPSPPPSSFFQDVILPIATDPNVNAVVYFSTAGDYYSSKFPRHPGDMLVQFPSPGLLALLEVSPTVNAEVARNTIANAAGAGILGETAADGVTE